MDTAIVKQVIETTLLRRGDGETTPIRIIRQYWDTDGALLAEHDPSPDHERTIANLQAQLGRAASAINWALGTTDFDVPENPTPYWWRRELRQRAGL